jgi:predicted RNA binding protein YcfA (HicA-like mRNA interferase family)
MKVPRDLSGSDIVKALSIYGYRFIRQKGSHIMITTQQNGEHHLAIPNHDPLKIGTLNAILSQVANHFGMSKEDVLKKLIDHK